MRCEMVYEKNGVERRYADSTYLLNEIARLKAEHKYFGDFAPQRHLFEQYSIKGDEIDEQ